LDLHRLRLLTEVAERGSLTAAALALSYSTSSVSEQIAALEREAGLPLLERGARGVRLTEAGRLVVSRAHEILAGVTALRAELDDLAGLRAGQLHLGAFSTAGARLVPRAAAAFRARHAGVRLELSEADPDDALVRLAARELDVALIYRFEHYEEPPDARHEEVALLTDELRVLLPAGHRLARRERLALTDLAEEPWVQGVRRGSTLNILPAACAAAGFAPQITFRTDDIAAVQGFVAAGVGVAVISNLVLPLARDDLVVRPLVPALRRTVSVAVPRSGARPPAATALVDVLKAVGDELIAEAGGLYGPQPTSLGNTKAADAHGKKTAARP
jgi:DNA-binding transcriptional LysR family regulator